MVLIGSLTQIAATGEGAHWTRKLQGYSQGGRSRFIRFCFAKTPATLADAVSRLRGWKTVLDARQGQGRL